MIPLEVFEQTLIRFFEPVGEYLEDPSVSEIMINGPAEIYVERGGRLELTEARFPSREALLAACRNLAQFVGREVNEERPILEAHLPDGSRVEAVFPPACREGPYVVVRRFSKNALTVPWLVEKGSLTPEAAYLIEGLVACKQNVIVSGGTGSGKTSLLGAVSRFISPGERVVLIEDTRELQLQQPHVVRLEARPPDARGRGEITIRELFRATLRMRPDRIVIGEVRGSEALDLVQAMISGHGGCLSTVHATNPADTLKRLETLALMSDVELPLAAVRAQIASAIEFVVQTSRLNDGSRVITHISEVTGYQPDRGYQIADLFVRRIVGQAADGTIVSVLEATGIEPTCHELLTAMGYGVAVGRGHV